MQNNSIKYFHLLLTNQSMNEYLHRVSISRVII